MKAFLICPVRGIDSNTQTSIVRNIEESGYDLHWPPRDTNQVDDTGLRICQENKQAIVDADVVFFLWDGKSQGSLFDLGIAFALNKKIEIVDIPELTSGKSFQNMVMEWQKLQ